MRLVLGIVGAVFGAALGWLIFDWLLGNAMYAMILPGALIGVGASLGSRSQNMPLGIICGITALALGIFLEWKYLPFAADESLQFFLTNLFQVDPVHLIMIAVGGIAGFMLGKGRDSLTHVSESTNPASS